jgi:hypothetical protein
LGLGRKFIRQTDTFYVHLPDIRMRARERARIT